MSGPNPVLPVLGIALATWFGLHQQNIAAGLTLFTVDIHILWTWTMFKRDVDRLRIERGQWQ